MLYIAGPYSQVMVTQEGELSTVGMITVDDTKFGRISLVLAYPKAVDQWLDVRVESAEAVIFFLGTNRYNGRTIFYPAKESKRCAEPFQDPSLQTRLSLL
jgi:hypothetical protein